MKRLTSHSIAHLIGQNQDELPITVDRGFPKDHKSAKELEDMATFTRKLKSLFVLFFSDKI